MQISMIFKTVANDITGVTDKISIFNSTLSTMQRNLKSGQGVLYSFFGGNKITQNDVQAITNYVNAVKSGVGTGKAWQTTMSNCSVAAKQYVVSAKRAGQSTTELVTGLKTVPKATTAASIGLKALSIAGNMLMFWAITEGIQLAIKALDKLIVTTKEAKEALDNSVSSFKSATDELKGLESELKTTSDRLSELQKLADNNTISIAEEKELELLKQQNAELARKIALKKEEQIDTAKQVLKDAKKYSNKKVTSSYVYVAGTYDQGVPQYDSISAVDEMSIALDKYYSNTNRTSTNQQNPKDVIENMYAIIEPTIEAYEALINADYKLSDAEQAHYEKLRSLQDRYLKFRYNLNGMKETYQALSVEQQKNILLNRLIAQGLSDIQANAVLGSVSESDYVSLWEKGFTFTPPQMTDYTTAEEYGKAYADAWLNGVESVVESADEKPVLLSVSDTIDQLNTKLKSAMDSLKSAWQDIFTDDGFALENIDLLSTADSIKSKLDELNEIEGITVDYSAFENFIRVLEDTNSTEQDVKRGFNELATSITNAGLSGSEDFETLKDALEDLGVINNELVAFDALISNTEALKEAGLDLANATDEQVAKFANEMVSAENTSQAIAMLTYQKELCNIQNMSTAEEVANLKTLAENAGYTGEVIQYLTELEQIYQAVASGVYGTNTQQVAMAQERARQLQTLIAESANKVNYEPKVDFSDATKSASKAGSKAGDAYVEAYEKELEALGNLRDRGEITEAEYLSRMKALYEKYFAGISKYQDKYFEEQQKYLEGMESLYNSALSGISKLMSNKIDAVQEEKEVTISALEEERDARLEVIEAQKEQLQAEIDLIDEQIDGKQEIIDSINDEIDKMREANEERKRQQDLMLAQYNLQKMLSQRTKLVNICQTL